MNVTLLLLKVTLLLAVALVLLTALGRANPRWRLLLCEWSALGLLVLPLLAELPLSLTLPLADPAQAAPVEPALPVGEVGLAGEALTGVTSASHTVPAGPRGEDDRRRSVLTSELRENLPAVLLAIYMAGLFWIFRRYLNGAWRLRRILASLEPAGDAARGILAEVTSELQWNRVPHLLVANEPIAPFACGTKGGTVVIPRVLVQAGNEEGLRLALRHETHHLANRDLLRAWLLQILTAVFWFHPLAWALRRYHSLAMEELGDRVAAENAGTANYARSLAAFALWLRPESHVRKVSLGWLSQPRILRRLRNLKRRVPHSALSARSRALALGGLGGPLLWIVSTLGYADPKDPEGEWAGLSQRLAAGLNEEAAERAAAVAKLALHYVGSLQREDGSVSARPSGESQYQTGTTSLAGMAFYVAGGSKPDSPWRAPMLNCLDYVLQTQDEGGVFKESKKGKASMLYHHFIATWFMAHARGSVDGERKLAIDSALPSAVGIILTAQQVNRNPQSQGGWRYQTNSQDSDISCTAWALNALLAARSAGVEVPQDAIEDGVTYMLRLQNEQDGGFAYVDFAKSSNLARTGMALSILQQTGKGRSPEAARAAAYILTMMENGGESDGAYPYYGLFWCAAGMALRGGDDAKRFAEWMYAYCAEKQAEDGTFVSPLGTVLPTISVVLAMAPVVPADTPAPE